MRGKKRIYNLLIKRTFIHSVIRTLKMLYKISRFYFITTIIFTILLGISSALTVYATKILINVLQLGINDTSTFMTMLFLYGAINIGISIVRNLQNYFFEKYHLYVDNQMDILCLEKSKHLELKDFEDNHIYDIINRATEMGRTKIYGLYINFILLIQSIVSIIFIYAVIMNVNKYLFLLVLIIPIISTFVNIVTGKKQYNMLKRRTKKNRQLSYINYLLTNNIAIKEILSYGCHDYLINKYKKINNMILSENNQFLRFRTLVNFVLNFFEEALSLAVIIFVMIMTKAGHLLIGDTVAYINSLSTIAENLKVFMSCLSAIYSDRLFIEDFFVFLDLKEADQTTGIEVKEIQDILFEHVSFSYENTDKLTLKDISFRIDNSKPIVIIGKNGSGKTSLIKLIAGLYKTYSGNININGVELRKLDTKSYKSRIGIIFQDFNKYELSIRENVGLAEIGKLNNNTELYHALKTVDMDKVIGNDLDIQMGKWFGGRELSKGQWQRIAIARSIIKESDVLVLDEPTSALDPVMEREIFRLIKEISKQKILIFITHRIENLLEFDPNIFIMKDGEIVASGNQGQLISDPHFNELLIGK